MRIRPYQSEDLPGLVALSWRAWEPVYAALEEAWGADLYRALVPDWRRAQREAVEAICTGGDAQVWVAQADEGLVGFVAVVLRPDDYLGEIHMVAVDPGFQRRGLGAKLTGFAVDRIREAGLPVAMVETGADSGHAPARRTYERAGFQLIPVARYFKKL